MFFFPYSTDAPIFFFPRATIGLIVANVLVFIFEVTGTIPIDSWMLVHRQGLHPHQWVTSAFLHGDVFHLLSNMFFLWGFGLIVEGKIGWWKYLAVYMGIAVGQNAFEQVVMLYSADLGPGGSLGASTAIFGLLAMAWIWAPRNVVSFFIFIFPMFFFTFDVPILGFGAFFMGWELLKLMLIDFAMSSELLHMTGALPGLVVGVAMLKLDLVDCEGWDLFTVIAGREGTASPPWRDPQAEQARQHREFLRRQREEAQQQVTRFLANGQTQAALTLARKMRLTLPQHDLIRAINGMIRAGNYNPALLLIEEYLARFTQHGSAIRLKQAHILLEHFHKASRALDVMRQIDPMLLTDKQALHFDRLKALAQKKQRDEYQLDD